MTEHEEIRISLDTSIFTLSNELSLLRRSSEHLTKEDQAFLKRLNAQLNSFCSKLEQV